MSDSSLLFEPRVYLIPVAYLMGSIPFGVLVARKKGIDIRSVGSRNIGATNVLRTVGKLPALITLIGDVLKGGIPVYLGRILGCGELLQGLIGLAAVIGHMFSVFLHFSGGKGVATGFGVIAIYSPLSGVIAFLVWLLTAFVLKYSSLAAIVSYTALPLIFAIIEHSRVMILFALLLSCLVILKHRENIMNLLHDTEGKIGR
jgi:glycerol-3-phosphate acyltransferase PlsY